MLERLAGEITSSLAARLATANGASHGRILAVFDWLADWVCSPAFHGCLFIKAASEYPEPGERPRQAAEVFKAGCRQLLEGQCRELGIDEPQRLARHLHLLLEGALMFSFLERVHRPPPTPETLPRFCSPLPEYESDSRRCASTSLFFGAHGTPSARIGR